MNDIEVLEELIKNEHGELLNCWDYGEEAKQAIENLLKERQSDKEKIEELEENYSILEKAYFTDSIPKSLIKEKIEEHKAKTDCRYCNNSCDSYSVCKVLEELLKGE